MDINFYSWEDFNNISVNVKICRKKYNAILIKENNSLHLKIDMSNDLETWRNHNAEYELLNGVLICNKMKVTFLNCISLGTTYKSTAKEAIAIFRVDRLLLGKHITKSNIKSITKYEICYDNIDCLTDDKLCKFNYETNEIRIMPTNYFITTNDLNINIFFGASFTENSNKFLVKRDVKVGFINKKKIKLNEMLKNIYCFRNFLMILLKKSINVKKQLIFFGDEDYRLIDCNNEKDIEVNDDLEEMLNHRCIKIEKIDNLNEIYQNFLNIYNYLIPVLEIYYNFTQFRTANLTKFVNVTTMVENYSRAFDFDNALKLTLEKNPKNKNKDPEYIDMIKSLINNINEIYKFNNIEIDKISENVKNARVFYIHYKEKETTKKLNYNEQFYYFYFLQDLILLNIYKYIGLDFNKFEYLTFLEFYYDKEDLLI